MADTAQPGPSEFEKTGPHKSGVFGLGTASEKARYERRIGENTDDPTHLDLDAEPKPFNDPEYVG
jgi:hypothetical protein